MEKQPGPKPEASHANRTNPIGLHVKTHVRPSTEDHALVSPQGFLTFESVSRALQTGVAASNLFMLFAASLVTHTIYETDLTYKCFEN